jgi:hypothetical protein
MEANKELIDKIFNTLLNHKHADRTKAAEEIAKLFEQENSRLKQAQQAIWVKASEPNIKEGEYVAKFFATEMNLIHPFVGMAFVEKDFIRLCCPGHYDKKWRKGHEELQHVQILHESSSTSNYSALKEENEKLNESCKKLFDQNTRFYNDYVALKEKTAKMEDNMLSFVEYAAEKCWWDEEYKLWNTYDESANPFRFTTAELYQQFQKDKVEWEKEEGK